MKKTKLTSFTKKFLLFLPIFLALFIIPFISKADITLTPPVSETEVGQLIKKGAAFLWSLVGGLATIMMIWAGILFLTSEGDPGRVAQAKKMVTYIVIGIAVAIVASGIGLILTEIFS